MFKIFNSFLNYRLRIFIIIIIIVISFGCEFLLCPGQEKVMLERKSFVLLLREFILPIDSPTPCWPTLERTEKANGGRATSSSTQSEGPCTEEIFVL